MSSLLPPESLAVGGGVRGKLKLPAAPSNTASPGKRGRLLRCSFSVGIEDHHLALTLSERWQPNGVRGREVKLLEARTVEEYHQNHVRNEILGKLPLQYVYDRNRYGPVVNKARKNFTNSERNETIRPGTRRIIRTLSLAASSSSF